MSLLAWFPFTKNGNNQGITNINYNIDNMELVAGKLGNCLKIDNHYSTITLTELPNSKQVSFAFWFRELEETCTTWKDFIMIQTHYDDGTKVTDGETRLENFNSSSTGKVCANWYSTVFNKSYPTDTSAIDIGSNFQVGTNIWHHSVLQVDFENHTWACWFDGKFISKQTINPNALYFTGLVRIGDDSITCNLNDLRIYDHLLSTKEIKDIYKTLIAHYPLNSGYGNENLMKMNGLGISGATSVSYDSNTDTYTIVSPQGTTTWGYGLVIKMNNEISIPYGKSYRASLEVYVPTRHTIIIDINNDVASGTAWAGNDNDNGSKRTLQSFKIPANKWTKIVWGSENSNSKNTNKINILPFDKIGLKTDSDTAPVTWYIRHPKVEIGTEATEWVPNKADALYSTLGYNNNIEYDTSGYGNNGTKYNNPISVGNSAIGNSCLSFNGTNQYIALGRNCMVRDEITVNLWGYMENWSNFNSPQMRLISCTEGGGWNFEPKSEGLNFAVGVGETSNTYTDAFSSQTINLSKVSSGWHMITGTFDGINKKIYLDGVLKGTISLTEKKPIFYNANNGIFIAAEAGGHITNPDGDYFKGNISDVRIYATALSDEDIKQLYETKMKIDKESNLYCNQFIESENSFINLTRKSILNTSSLNENISLYDMKTKILDDGSMWTRIFWHDYTLGGNFTHEMSLSLKTNYISQLGKYSRLYKLESFRNEDGAFEFLINYPKISSTQYNRWIQTANPMLTKGGTNVTQEQMGYKSIHLDYTGQAWKYGLATGVGAALISSCAGLHTWFYSIGCYSWSNGFPRKSRVN